MVVKAIGCRLINLSRFIKGLVSPSLLAPKYRSIVLSRPSSPFHLRRFTSAPGMECVFNKLPKRRRLFSA